MSASETNLPPPAGGVALCSGAAQELCFCGVQGWGCQAGQVQEKEKEKEKGKRKNTKKCLAHLELLLALSPLECWLPHYWGGHIYTELLPQSRPNPFTNSVQIKATDFSRAKMKNTKQTKVASGPSQVPISARPSKPSGSGRQSC
jgi:hypothetical protein